MPTPTPPKTPARSVRGKPLTDRELRREIAIHADADAGAEIEVGGARGLFLAVRPGRTPIWVHRYTTPGKVRRRVSLGSFPAVTLAGARAAALATVRDLAAGVDPVASPDEGQQPIAAAVGEYLAACANRLAPRTCQRYRDDLGRFLTWASSRAKTLADLDRGLLSKYRDATIGAPVHAPVRGGKQGQRKPSKVKRIGPERVNSILQTIKTFLVDQRRRGKLDHLDRESIEDTLRPLPLTRERPEFLTPAQIRKLLEACMRHDEETFELTRDEHDGKRVAGSTPRYVPIAPFAAFLLLSGCRRGEALGLRWTDIDLDALDHSGERVGEIRLRGDRTKTRRARTIGLEVSPALRTLLAAIKLCGKGDPVLGQTKDGVVNARARLMADYGAPPFDWQMLRSTCSTFLNCSPGIFGRASHSMAAKQLGHSVVVAERHYADLVRGISREARTLEAAMQCEGEVQRVVSALAGPTSKRARLTLASRK